MFHLRAAGQGKALGGRLSPLGRLDPGRTPAHGVVFEFFEFFEFFFFCYFCPLPKRPKIWGIGGKTFFEGGSAARRRVRSGLAPQPTSPSVAALSGESRETRGFSRLVATDSEPETAPGACFRRESARRLHSRIDGSVWGGWLGSADAEQLALCRPGDRQVQGPDQMVGSQV